MCTTEKNGVVWPLRSLSRMDSSELIQLASEAFAQGKPVMVFDSDFRECETDLLWPAAAATPAVMRRLRQDCGGLLFLAVGDDVGEQFGLPWLQDLHTHPALVEENPVLGKLITDDLQYDTRSAFTLSLNHRETFTGITDHDRALTTRRFGELANEMKGKDAIEAMTALGKEFRTPGHIPLCREAPGGLKTRQGHTELAVAIARLAGLVPCTIGAEMLQPDGDRALSVEDARAYAAKHQIPMLTGEDIMKAFGL
ncbi:MAG: 3,4-dihydroxy-2-butanone-4-phosphate synthase [Euryarchaeota archaeon]|nr:3,4-dihydroxy-2-butanone-4-phosphate synthase [Euryarchaeota archaeon]